MKRQPAALQELEKRYRLLFEHMTSGFALHEILCDDQGNPVDYRFLEINPAFEQLTGMKAAEIVGKTVLEVFPQTEDYWIKTYGAVALTGKAVSFEKHFQPLGRTYEVMAYSPASRQFAVIFIDITEHKQTEEKVRSLYEQQLLAQKASRAGFWDWDMLTGKLCWSAPFLELFGFPPDVPQTFETWLAAVHPQDREKAMATITRSIDEHISLKNEYRIILPGGDVRWISAFGSTLYDKVSGQALRMTGMCLDVSDRYKDQELLRASQGQLVQALKIGHLAPWEYDVVKDEFTFNDYFYDMFRTTAQAVGGYTMPSAEYAKRFVHPQDAALVAEEVRKAIETADPQYSRQIEHRIIYADGQVGYVQVRYFIVKDEQGRTVRTYGVNQDITDRRKAEAALRESEVRYRELFDSSTSGVAVYEVKNDGASGSDYIVKDFNRVALRDAGMDKSQVIGKRLIDIRPGVDAFGIIPVFRQVWKTGVPAYYPAKMYADGKSSHWYENQVYRLPSGEIVAVFNDVTDVKKAEEELLMKNALLEGESETTLDGILVVDKQGKVVFANCNFRKIWGLPENVVAGVDDAVPLNLVLERVTSSDQFLEKVKYLYDHENERSRDEIELKDGRVLDRYSSPLVDSKGVYRGRIWFFRDVTERVKSKEQLEEAYKDLKETQTQLVQSAKMAAMGQLVAGVSHELNQPLTGIKGFAQTAYAELAGMASAPEMLRQDLQKIIDQADRMVGIIENLRLFSRKPEARTERLDLNLPIRAAVQLLEQQFKIHNIDLILNLAENQPQIMANSNQLQQVFLNFLTNARDAIESAQRQPGRIEITSGVAADGKHIEVYVRDNGCGIRQSQVEHIFNPFFTTKAPNHGMGLGLSIVYSIINNHDGAIEVHSEEGKGTEFKVLLPIA